jgi:poly-gamma-glutamate capsule biosynthesis protein CapA/YwtB (metallophosphatase superfamily)
MDLRTTPPSLLETEPLAAVRGLLRHVPPEEIPAPEDLYSADALEDHLSASAEPPYTLIGVGDIMLGGRAKRVIAENGGDYPFAAVRPLLRRAAFVLGNLEGPLARKARRRPRTFSYRVNPELAPALTRAGIRVVTLANNHLLDCGRGGVRESLHALAQAGIAPLGAGRNETAAHAPVCRPAGPWRVGLLGYYWNRRCAATADLPGSAMDPPAALAADLGRLRTQVDRVVVTFHWGVPYEREPAPADRAKARLAVDCGADVVIGHHPHIVQPFEIYRGRPIFYSVGNFVLGSGNSRAEGLALGLRFDERRTVVDVFPLYVKNRDPRVNYQPKVLRGPGGDRLLVRLAAMSGPSGELLAREGGRGRLDLPADPAGRGREVPDG